MSDESSAAVIAAQHDAIAQHRALYIGSGGAQGHIGDSTAIGGHNFSTRCLVRYKGRKSGKIFITPLIYGSIGGEVVICGSKGGADHHPAWYLNIVGGSREIDFQIATQAVRATWREPEGAERDKVWAFMIDVFPVYAGYQASTDRPLPLVMMKPVAEIPVFTDPDA
jgi:deazaflavin-dependent oxidoreductase (nitroreductase family)